MPAKLRMVTLWTDMQANAGTCIGAIGRWSSLRTSYRNDGDDRVSGTIPRTEAGVPSIVQGSVLRFEREDDAVEEWIVQVVRDPFGSDVVQVEAVSARAWLAERVMVRSGTDLTLSGSGTISAVLTTLLATTEWPSWVVAGTVSNDVTISYDWNQSNGLAALLAMVESANATEAVTLANETVRLAFRRVSNSQYALDFLTTAVSGDPILAEGKNLSAFAVRQDRIQRASAIYPINANGATIAEAMFAVRSTSGGTTMDMRDWAYRDDFLGIAFDGQWVGWYAVAPDDSTTLITGSTASTQQLEVADNSAWGSGNNATVRISQTSGGTPTVFVADTTVANRRKVILPGTWSSKINWVPNSRWDEWTSSTVVKDWSVGGGTTINRLSGGGDFETGTYGLEFVTGGSVGQLDCLEVLMPDTYVETGTVTWRVGMRYKRTANTGGSAAFRYSKNSGSSYTTLTAMGASASFATFETTFTTTSGDSPPRLRFEQLTATAGTKWVIDRVWLFRDGVDDGDNTIVGNGPSVGFYTGQRELLAKRTAGTAYEVGVIDRYRDDPTGYPDDKLAVNQEVRLMVPSRAVDTTVTLAGLEVDELQPLSTTAQVGSLRRRLTTNL